MINPPNNNKFIGLQDQQTLGQLNDPLQAEQDFLAKRMSQPVPVPGNQTPMMQQQKGKMQTVQNDPKLQEGSDASYGISGYVNTKKEYKQALQQKNHPNVYSSPAKQTNYPHARVKQRAIQPLMPKPNERIGKVEEAVFQPMQREVQKPYRTGYERIVRNKRPDAYELQPDIQQPRFEQVPQKTAPFRQDDPNKGKPYVVNKEKTGTSKDTLFLPKNAYVSKGGYMDDVEYEQEAKTAAAKGIYNYTKSLNFENLEGSGKVKYKK